MFYFKSPKPQTLLMKAKVLTYPATGFWLPLPFTTPKHLNWLGNIKKDGINEKWWKTTNNSTDILFCRLRIRIQLYVIANFKGVHIRRIKSTCETHSKHIFLYLRRFGLFITSFLYFPLENIDFPQILGQYFILQTMPMRISLMATIDREQVLANNVVDKSIKIDVSKDKPPRKIRFWSKLDL